MNITISNARRFFVLFIMLMFSGQHANADISGVHSMGGQCITGWSARGHTSAGEIDFTAGGSCVLTSDNYAPASGMYSVELILTLTGSGATLVDQKTNPFMIDASKTLAQQSIYTSGPPKSVIAPESNGYQACQYLVDSSGKKFTEATGSGCRGSGIQPLPPTPAIPDTSCTINSGNALNVNLSTVDRALVTTVPGSGSMRHIQVPVECTGGDVTVNMQLNYTPISLSAGQVIKSSSNGLGVSVVYNSKILSSTDITPVTFTAGSNSIDLAFQAVRDPTVEIKDVPTGAFTASAVLVMTQQ